MDFVGDIGFFGDIALLDAITSESGGGVKTGAATRRFVVEPSCKPRPLAFSGVPDRGFVELSKSGLGAFGVFSLDLLGVRGRFDVGGEEKAIVLRSPSDSGGDETVLGGSGWTSIFFGVVGFIAEG